MSTKHDDLMCSKKTLSDILLAIEKQGIFDLSLELKSLNVIVSSTLIAVSVGYSP